MAGADAIVVDKLRGSLYKRVSKAISINIYTRSLTVQVSSIHVSVENDALL